jgi:hypothetical protein
MPVDAAAPAWEKLVPNALSLAAGPWSAPPPELEANPPPCVLRMSAQARPTRSPATSVNPTAARDGPVPTALLAVQHARSRM